MQASLGRNQLLKRLAVGGMGEVWLARPLSGEGPDTLVVVKVLRSHLKVDQDFVNMFFDEARIASALVHPGIVRIHELGEDDGEYFIVMEYVRGASLKEVVDAAAKQGRPLPLALACRVIADAAGALGFAHQATTPTGERLDLIHRDVSPHNILVAFDGVVKLIDFGVAKAANKLVRTATGVIKGKYAYMSPEQAYGQPLDGRSDVFGLGIVLWELLTGERLFKRASETETLKAVVEGVLRPPSQLDRSIPKALDALVMKALEREVEDRFQSAEELQRALERFLVRARLPATPSHLDAYLRTLFPGGAGACAASASESDATVSTDSGPDRPLPRAASLGSVLDAAELRARIASTSPGDVTRGVFFSALFTAVMRAVGPLAELEVRRALEGERRFVDSIDYPTADFLTVLWKGVELLAPKHDSVDQAFEQLGLEMMEALWASPFGTGFRSPDVAGPVASLTRLVETLNVMMTPGARRVAGSGPRLVTVVFKEEVLPIQLFLGLFRSLARTVHGVELQVAWERTAAERVEVHLRWGASTLRP